MENQSIRPDFNDPYQNAIVSGDWLGDRADAYRVGFMQATLVLLAAATTEVYVDPNTGEDVVVYLDALVYPIFFNARHFSELFLKDSLRGIAALAIDDAEILVKATHDLNELWAQFETVIAKDTRLKKLGMPLCAVIKDIAAVDNTGMTFRYARDNNDQEHLAEHKHINLAVFGKHLRAMFKQAEEFSTLLEVLQQEYAQRTFIGKMHRGTLETIAQRLPPYEKWTQELESVKRELCQQLGLSSNEFGKALNLIKRHREFAGLIGLELPLQGLPLDIFTRLALVHDGKADYDSITTDEWLRLDAVLEISKPHSWSEEYDEYLQQISVPEFERRLDRRHLTRNAYARNQRLRRGLLKLGQRTLLAALANAIPDLAKPPPPPLNAEQLSALVSEAFEHVRRSTKAANSDISTSTGKSGDAPSSG